jgi:hypothetical protein
MISLLRLSLLAYVLMVGIAMAQDSDLDPANTSPSDAAADALETVPNEGNNTKTRTELCTSDCDRDFAICSDEGSSAAATLNDRPSATQIDSIRCKDDLAKCMKGCRGL